MPLATDFKNPSFSNAAEYLEDKEKSFIVPPVGLCACMSVTMYNLAGNIHEDLKFAIGV